MRSVMIVLALVAGPVLAQEDVAAALGREVYRLAVPGSSRDAMAGYLRDAIRSAGGSCHNVMVFQLFSQSRQTRTLKVQCVGVPLKLVTVDAAGHILLASGRSIAPINAEDGPIIKIEPVFLPHENVVAPNAELDQASGLPPLLRGYSPWLPLGLGVIVGLLGLKWVLRQREWQFDAGRWQNLTSVDKDRLLEESRELFPNIFVHPDGVFIARGRHGKRRLFRSLMFAYLYRNYGWKIGQIV